MQKETGFIVKGKLHEECDSNGCGEKFFITGTNERVELEEGEAVIIPEAFEPQCFSDSFCKKPSTYKMTGTIKQIASAINMLGGGSNFKSGAQVWKNGRKITVPKYTAENQRRNPKNIKSGSVIINRTNMNDPQVLTFEGTAYEIASHINSYGGNGVVLDGVEKTSMKFGGQVMEIRPFSKDELIEFYNRIYPKLDYPNENILEILQADYYQTLVNPRVKILGAFVNGKMVGGTSYQPHYTVKNYIEVISIITDPDYRSRNVGRNLLSAITKETGNKKLIAHPYTNKAEKFFLKHGFEIDEEIDPADDNTVIRTMKFGGNAESRYVAEMDYYVWAEDDKQAQQKAEKLADLLPEESWAKVNHLFEQPSGTRLSRKIFNKGGEVTLTKEQIKELGKLIEAETKAVNKLRSFYELKQRKDYESEKKESIDIATAIWRSDREGDLTQGQMQRERLIQWAKDRKNKVKFIVAFSGGKDSVAMVLHLMYDLEISKDDIELWHHEVDGHGEDLWDWKCTTSYCKAFAEAYGLPILFSYRKGGITREIYRKNEGQQDVFYQSEMNGKYHHIKATDPKAEDRKTKYKFPAKSKNLNTRWCSANVKIDVMKTAINNNPAYENLTAIICTGERRLESQNRAGYLEVEPYNFAKDRQIIQWRPVIDWDEEQIWNTFQRRKIQPHPAYMLGWGRCSCQLCIFSSPNHWATNNAISPEKIKRIAEIETETGSMLDNKPHLEPMRDETGQVVVVKSGKTKGQPRMVKQAVGQDDKGNIIYKMKNIYEAQVDIGNSFLNLTDPIVKRWLPEAIGEFVSPIFVSDWQLPEGAFKGDDCGAD